MAKKPTDLTSKSWNKLKEMTVPKTGFGDKLDAYAKAKKVTEVLTTRKLASFSLAATALGDITKHIAVAQGKCNKTLHKDTIAALEAYKPLIATESGALNAEFVTYQGYIDNFNRRGEVALKEMTAHKQHMTTLTKASVDAVKKALLAKDFVTASQSITGGLAALKKAQDATNLSLEKWREPILHAVAAHADDRGDDSRFQTLIGMQKNITDMRAIAETALATSAQALESAMPKVPQTPKGR